MSVTPNPRFDTDRQQRRCAPLTQVVSGLPLGQCRSRMLNQPSPSELSAQPRHRTRAFAVSISQFPLRGEGSEIL